MKLNVIILVFVRKHSFCSLCLWYFYVYFAEQSDKQIKHLIKSVWWLTIEKYCFHWNYIYVNHFNFQVCSFKLIKSTFLLLVLSLEPINYYLLNFFDPIQSKLISCWIFELNIFLVQNHLRSFFSFKSCFLTISKFCCDHY